MAKNERDLGDALLKFDAAGMAAVPDAKQQTERILRRDRRRLRWWTVLTIVAWLPAVIFILAVLVELGLLFPLQAKLVKIREEQKAGVAKPGDEYVHNGRKLNLPQLERDTDTAFKKLNVLTVLSVLALSFATLFSLILISSSRRATLRQINASLLEISQQLKRS
jgi:ABC-type Fe3+ transport system permease subunit